MDALQAIRRLKDGDIGGLESLVVRYQAKALRVAFLITQDQALAEDEHGRLVILELASGQKIELGEGTVPRW